MTMSIELRKINRVLEWIGVLLVVRTSDPGDEFEPTVLELVTVRTYAARVAAANERRAIATEAA